MLRTQACGHRAATEAYQGLLGDGRGTLARDGRAGKKAAAAAELCALVSLIWISDVGKAIKMD